MLPTLQWYIFREMGKTFILTAIGLTVVLGLGGGVVKLVDLEQVTPSQLLQLVLIVLPVAGTLTLPVAALYGATATYGRLSADNEFVACRASGINIGRLFLPPLMLSLLTAGSTFYFTCFMIPGMVRDLSTLARADLRDFVEQRLNSPERLALPGGKKRVYADRVVSPSSPGTVELRGVAFLESGDQAWTRYGTAEALRLHFPDSADVPVIAGSLTNLAYFDRQRHQWLEVGHNVIEPSEVHLRMRPRVKWLNLKELFAYRAAPQRWPRVEGLLGELRAEMSREAFYAWVMKALIERQQVTLSRSDGALTFGAATVTPSTQDGHLSFERLSARWVHDQGTRSITGGAAELLVEGGDDAAKAATARLEITQDVTVQDSSIGGPEIRKGRERLDGLRLPPEVAAAVASIDDAQLLASDFGVTLHPAAAALRERALAGAKSFVRDVTSELHSRLAFSVSAFVLVLFGAALGVLFRGAHVVSAFGISFVPSVFVIVMNIMGRQLAEKPGTEIAGLWVIWGSLAIVGVLDLWTLRRVIRR